jgi:hypothetical protein
MFAVMPEREYEHRIKGSMAATGGRSFENLPQSCAKKLLDCLVDYAYESPADIQRIINTLTKKCGEGGFHTVLRLTDGMNGDDDFM